MGAIGSTGQVLLLDNPICNLPRSGLLATCPWGATPLWPQLTRTIDPEKRCENMFAATLTFDRPGVVEGLHISIWLCR